MLYKPTASLDMKKILLSVAVLSILMAPSCKKSDTQTPLNLSSRSVDFTSDLKAINAKHKYVADPRLAGTPMTEQEKSIRTAVTVAADLIGAGTVGKLGGSIGGWIGSIIPGAGTAVGGGLGAGIGAALGGTVASYEAWKRHTHNMPLGPGDDAEAEQEIIDFNGTYAESDPYNNPYESVGRRHNQLMKALMSRNTVLAPTFAAYSIYDSTDLDTNEKLLFRSDTPDYITNHINWLITDTPDVYQQIDQIFAGDTTVKSILETFLAGLYEVDLTEIGEIHSYVNDYEGYFISNNNITDEQRNVLMCTFATAKHSAAMWLNAFTAVQ